jgi:hypothetical protein
MARNTVYVIRVGTETPQGDGYTYLRWCDGEDYRWAGPQGRPSTPRPQGSRGRSPGDPPGHAC